MTLSTIPDSTNKLSESLARMLLQKTYFPRPLPPMPRPDIVNGRGGGGGDGGGGVSLRDKTGFQRYERCEGVREWVVVRDDGKVGWRARC